MRVHFQLKSFEPFYFDVEDESYTFLDLERLAEKSIPATNIHEYVYKLPTGKHVYLTVVGDEDQDSAYGIQRGWYVAKILSDKDAEFLIKALSPFTNLDV